ncbi:hypothetical protein HDU86_004923 [Geranomyces michiganensis]|nr:hypothetical protein HDU86_004923 [Geranomyces michiganensis]
MNTPKGFFSPWGGGEPRSAGGRETAANLRPKQRLNFNFCVAHSHAFDPVTYTPRDQMVLKCQFMDSVGDPTQTTVKQLKKQVLATWKAVEESGFDRIVDTSQIRKVVFRNSDNSTVPDHLAVADAFDEREYVHVLAVVSTELGHQNLVLSENLPPTVPQAAASSPIAPASKRRRDDDDDDVDAEPPAEKPQSVSEISEEESGVQQAPRKKRRVRKTPRLKGLDDVSVTDAGLLQINPSPFNIGLSQVSAIDLAASQQLIDSPPRVQKELKSQSDVSGNDSDSENEVPTSPSPPDELEVSLQEKVAGVDNSTEDLPVELAETATPFEAVDERQPEDGEQVTAAADVEDEEPAANAVESETEDDNDEEAADEDKVEDDTDLPPSHEDASEEDEDEVMEPTQIHKRLSPEPQDEAKSEADVADDVADDEALSAPLPASIDVGESDENYIEQPFTQVALGTARRDMESESEGDEQEEEEIPDTQKTVVLTPSRSIGRNAALVSPPTSQDEAEEKDAAGGDSPEASDSSSDDDEDPPPSQLLLSQPAQKSPGAVLSRPTLDYFSQASQINLQSSQLKPQSAQELKRQLVPAKKLFRPPMPSGPRRVLSLSEIAESTRFPSLAELDESKNAAKRTREDDDDEEEQEEDDDSDDDSASNSSSSDDSSDADTAKPAQPAQPAVRLAGQRKKRKKKSPFLDLALNVARQPQRRPLGNANGLNRSIARPRASALRKPERINVKHLVDATPLSRPATPITTEALRSAVVQPGKPREELARELDGMDSE